MNSNIHNELEVIDAVPDEINARVEADPEYREYLKYFHESYEKAKRGELTLSSDTLWLAITENCNLRCVGCYTEGLFKKIYMDVDDIRTLLSSAPRPYATISLTEGEAFLHPKFCDIIEACKEIHPEAIVFVISNGNIPIKGRYRQAVAMIDRLGLSIDGATRETYEAIRQGGNFERFLQNVREIREVRRETGFPKYVGFSFTVTRTNLPELAGVVEIAHEMGIDEVFAQPMEMKDPIIEARIRDIHIDTMPIEDIHRYMSEARETARSLGVTLNFAQALNPNLLARQMAEPHAPAVAAAKIDQKVSTELSVRMCQFPWSQPIQLVLETGRYDVLPCCYMLRSAAAVVGKRYGLSYEIVRPIDEIYNSGEFWNLRRDLAMGKLADLCGDCAAAKSYPWKKPAAEGDG